MWGLIWAYLNKYNKNKSYGGNQGFQTHFKFSFYFMQIINVKAKFVSTVGDLLLDYKVLFI
jgi:hypothetical protein